VGTDFSNVPLSAVARARHADLRGGPLPLLELWNALSTALSEGRIRHGALMATLRFDHPDIDAFVQAKQRAGALPHFTLSLLVTDAFMAATEQARQWPLVFPDTEGDPAMVRSWPGSAGLRVLAGLGEGGPQSHCGGRSWRTTSRPPNRACFSSTPSAA
jgi:ribonucleoside-diphosphate reductase alpha chain